MYIRFVLICMTWFIWSFSTSALAQNSRPCRAMLKQKKYNQAIGCFRGLYRKNPKNLSFLRNQAILYRMWATAQPKVSCRKLQRAIAIYRRYARLVTGITRLEVTSRIAELNKKLGLGSLSLSSSPPHIRITIQGADFRKKVSTPFLFSRMCPGTYTVSATRKDHFPQTLRITLQPNQALAQSIQLRSKIVAKRPITETCPRQILREVGRKGCTWWEQCGPKSPDGCLELAMFYNQKNQELEELRYLTKACHLGHAKSCFRVGYIYEAMSRYKQSIRFYGRACRKKVAFACFRVAEFLATQPQRNRSLPRNVRRNCKAAIIYYTRACTYGHRKSCSKTCNRVQIWSPAIAHGALHVGTLVGGILLGTTNNTNTASINTLSIMGLSGSLTSLLAGLYSPLWYLSMRTHSLTTMIIMTSSNAITVGLGILFLASDIFGNLSTSQAFGGGILLFTAPIHILWTIYCWMSFMDHKSIAQTALVRGHWNPLKDWEPSGKSIAHRIPIRVHWSPMVLKDGMGFMVAGQF